MRSRSRLFSCASAEHLLLVACNSACTFCRCSLHDRCQAVSASCAGVVSMLLVACRVNASYLLQNSRLQFGDHSARPHQASMWRHSDTDYHRAGRFE